jgi:acetolactate synthase regulatory subunit
MRLASLMVRLMRRRHQAHEICGPHTGASIESMKSKIRFIVAYQRHKVLLEQFMDLLMSVEAGDEHWIHGGGP